MSSGFTRALNSFSLPYRNYLQLQSGTASGHDRHCLRTRQLQALNSIPGQVQPTDILRVKSHCTEKTRARHPCRRCLAFLLSASKDGAAEERYQPELATTPCQCPRNSTSSYSKLVRRRCSSPVPGHHARRFRINRHQGTCKRTAYARIGHVILRKRTLGQTGIYSRLLCSMFACLAMRGWLLPFLGIELTAHNLDGHCRTSSKLHVTQIPVQRYQHMSSAFSSNTMAEASNA